MVYVLVMKVDGPEYITDDIVDVMRDNWKYDVNLEKEFNIIGVEGYTKAELEQVILFKMPQIKRMWRSNSNNQWTEEKPEKSWAWRNGGRWKMMTNEGSKHFNISSITQEEREQLVNTEIPIVVKNTIINKGVWRFAVDSENQSEIPELNR